MHVCIDDFGDGFPTFPEFQTMLRAYERDHDSAGHDERDVATVRVPVGFWITHKGRGVRGADGQPYIFESLDEADAYIESHGLRMSDVAFYKLPQVVHAHG